MVTVAGVTLSRVLLRVENVAWMDSYHGRQAGLLGRVVDAVKIDGAAAVAYVDDRNGEASEFVEALEGMRNLESPVAKSALAGLQEFAGRWALHGQVMGVRT